MGKKIKKDDLLPVSKDCFQQGLKKIYMNIYSAQPKDLEAHSVLTEEAFSGHRHGRFQLCLSSQLSLFFYTLTVFICFRVATCTP